MTKHENPEFAQPRSNIAQAINRLRESDRQLALDYLRKGEFLGKLMGRVSGNLQSAVVLVSSSFARPSKWNERVERS